VVVRVSVFLRAAPLLLAWVLGVRPAVAHEHFEVDLALGYRAFGGVDIPDTSPGGKGFVSLDGSFVWSPIVGYRVRRDAFLFLNYTRQETTARFTPSQDALSSLSGGVAQDSIQFGGTVEKTLGRFVPYLGLSVGVLRLSAIGRSARDEWNFSAAFDGGLKFDVTRWLHLRVLGRLPLTFYGGKSSVLCLRADNCLVELDGQPSFQAEVLGGLGFSFL
jgi:hypothetical protein